MNNIFYWINEIGWNCKNVELKQLARMVVAIYEKRCPCYAHLAEKNDYNEVPEAFLTLCMNAKTLDIQKPNPRRWNSKGYVGPDG